MTPEMFAEWLRRQGHRVVRTASSYWHRSGPAAYEAFPQHWLIQPSESELLQVLRKERAICLRYSAPLSAPLGRLSYHTVYEKPTYGLEDLGQWARKNLRRGLKNCVVESISFERFAEEGWKLRLDTLDRQGRRLNVTHGTWRTQWLAATDLCGFEAWAAIVHGQLAATLITLQMDDCCYFIHQQSHRDYLNLHINNALTFEITRKIISRPCIHSIFYGLQSPDAPPSVDEFKLRMGYTAKPVRQRVIFHPLLSPFANAISHAVLKSLVNLRPGVRTLVKAEGLVRFYLAGKRPIQEQVLPEPLKGSIPGLAG